MARLREQLAQVRPAGTSAVHAFAGLATIERTVTLIIVCNQTGSSVNYSIYHDDDGATFSEDTALFFTVPLSARSTEVIDLNDLGITVASGGHLGVQTGTGNAITFSLYGFKGVQK